MNLHAFAAGDGLSYATSHQVYVGHAFLFEMIKSLTRIVKEIMHFFFRTRLTRVTPHARYARSRCNFWITSAMCVSFSIF
jgi:hypothetical protein